ncbi:MAG: class I SAM-dependent methyltransferase [Verrucomicrobiota bacterium]
MIINKLKNLGNFAGNRLLDVGCGDGSFTRILGQNFDEIHGIDVQESYLTEFRSITKDDHRFSVSNMSASAMNFPDNYFDTIVTIETLEHVPDLAGAASEISRVLKRGGELLITVPNRWFPFENHGMKIASRNVGSRIPLLPYFPWLHRRLALARVFTAGDLDMLFVNNGLTRAGLDYAWPTFEHGGNRFQRYLKPLFGLMRRLEKSPFRFFGSSVIVKYIKP